MQVGDTTSRALRKFRILMSVSPCVFIVLLAISQVTVHAEPYEGEGYGYGTENYCKIIEMNFRNRWVESADWKRVPPEFCEHGRSVVSFRLNKKGRVENVKLRHCALESLLPIYRQRLQDPASRLDGSVMEAVSTASPLPPPPKEMNCPRNMIVLFDPERFSPLKVMFDDGIPSMGGPISPIPDTSY